MDNAGTSRRGFLRQSLTAAVAAGAAGMASGAQGADAAGAAGAAGLAQGKIGDVTVSRLLLGGNLLTHYTHSRDLQYVYNLCAHYNTDEKIVETLRLAEEHGVNTLVVHTVPRTMNVLKKYRRDGGKMQWIICPTAPVKEDMSEYRKQVEELAGEGTDAIYVWGVTADKLVAEGKPELIGEAVELAKHYGVPSGVGAHDIRVVKECEERKIANDFYIKTFHHHHYPSAPKPDEIKGAYNEDPGYWCANPDELIALMANVEKTWIAFKVMAAGAIPPKDAFQYVFESGADHVLAGMFDFEIAEDAGIARDAFAAAAGKRTRPWRS